MNNRSENKPLVSIGLATYNREHYISEVIDCWLAQTFKDFELIISDDASSDGTQKICEEYAKKDERIKYIRQKKNLNQPLCFKFVLEQASGKYFAWAQDDDLYDKHFLEDCVKAMEKDPSLIMAFAHMVYIDKNRTVIRKFVPEQYFPGQHDLYERLKTFLLFPLGSGSNQLLCGLWKREAIIDDPLFGLMESDDHPPYKWGFDNYFIFRNLAKGPIGFSPEVRFLRRSRALEEYRPPRPLIPRIFISLYHRFEKIFGTPYFWYIFILIAKNEKLAFWQKIKLSWWNLFAMSRLFWKRKI